MKQNKAGYFINFSKKMKQNKAGYLAQPMVATLLAQPFSKVEKAE
jgi:hypothetical protein